MCDGARRLAIAHDRPGAIKGRCLRDTCATLSTLACECWNVGSTTGAHRLADEIHRGPAISTEQPKIIDDDPASGAAWGQHIIEHWPQRSLQKWSEGHLPGLFHAA